MPFERGTRVKADTCLGSSCLSECILNKPIARSPAKSPAAVATQGIARSTHRLSEAHRRRHIRCRCYILQWHSYYLAAVAKGLAGPDLRSFSRETHVATLNWPQIVLFALFQIYLVEASGDMNKISHGVWLHDYQASIVSYASCVRSPGIT